jgi:hypothetical protein
MALKHAESQWGKDSVLLAFFQFLLILMSLVAAFLHQRIYRRFNPVTTRGLEIYTKASPIQKSPFQKLKNLFKKRDAKKIDLIVFDLGEEIEFKNK